MKKKIFTFVVLIMVTCLYSISSAQVPQMINYQGKLSKTGTCALDTTISMTFKIYADSTTLTSLWSEIQNSVKVVDGVFNVLLGSAANIPDSAFNGGIRYLGVKVGSDAEMTPRKPIVSVAYAYRALMGDRDWSFRITDTADTTLITGGAWGIARYGNTLYGPMDSTHVNLGVASTTGINGQYYKYCTVGGGVSNAASGYASTIGGGYHNTAGYNYATVGGGLNNTASGPLTIVGGGNYNTASGDYAIVGGGNGNIASGEQATVGGGFINTASGQRSTIGGGATNSASGAYATVGGGAYDTANGQYATIPGGYLNTAAGDFAFAAGQRAKAIHSGTFVWADNYGADFVSTGNNQFLIRASGGVGIGTTSPNTLFEVRGENQVIRQASGTDPWRYIQMGYNPYVGPLIEGDGYTRLTLDADVGAAGKIVLGQGGDNVGIGTIDPLEKLHVWWDTNVDAELGRGTTDTDITYLGLRNANGTKCYIYPNAAGNGIVVSTTKP